MSGVGVFAGCGAMRCRVARCLRGLPAGDYHAQNAAAVATNAAVRLLGCSAVFLERVRVPEPERVLVLDS